MLRWLLTLISLQFLLGLGVSAWANTAHPGPAWPMAHSTAQCAAKPPAPVLEAPPASAQMPGSPGDSSTADSTDSTVGSVDLPDDLEFQRTAATDAALRFPCPTQPGLWLISQPAHRQLRPPRA